VTAGKANCKIETRPPRQKKKKLIHLPGHVEGGGHVLVICQLLMTVQLLFGEPLVFEKLSETHSQLYRRWLLQWNPGSGGTMRGSIVLKKCGIPPCQKMRV
jgi:hypothetical protein